MITRFITLFVAAGEGAKKTYREDCAEKVQDGGASCKEKADVRRWDLSTLLIVPLVGRISRPVAEG